MEKTSPEAVVIENRLLRLTVGSDCIARSLVYKETGEECLTQDQDIALFSSTQERPYNNEVKLAHPNKRTTYQGNRLRREGNRLIVGFEIIPYEAVIDIDEQPSYICFTFSDFIVHDGDYPLCMTPPPVSELRFLQLPVKNRKYFGEWLNVSWDEKAAVNILAASPYARIDSERRKGYRVMSADAVRGIKLRGSNAALIVNSPDKLLDSIDAMERDHGLPLGAQSRRSAFINRSAYWTSSINPQNVDEHIEFAKLGGFRHMLIYYTAIFKESGGYGLDGNYDYRPEYPEGRESLAAMLAKIREAGIVPGFHFLQTHIGLRSRYVTPAADHRLNKTTLFTLSSPLGKEDNTLFVEQNPEDAVMYPGCRVLQFGGELISYEAYTTEPPYSFTGCKRGAYDTVILCHNAGEIGGILDISEFGATSTYLDQNSSLQDEIAGKISAAYNAGFGFVYFDGSEGTNVPNGFHVPNAQYRVYRKLDPPPVYCEGAAKAHFSWHFLSGGNAFDVFPPEIFKKMIAKYPAEEAPRMRQDFTRLNFGWWNFVAPATQADMYEYGTSRAAAWDCPVTMMENTAAFKAHPRFNDIMKVMRRWEEVRANGWLTAERKEALRNLDQEHILLVDEDKQFELAPYWQIKTGDARLSAFIFEHKGRQTVVYWRTDGDGTVELPVRAADVELKDELYSAPLELKESENGIIIPASSRRYLVSALGREELEKAFANARFTD